MWIEREILPQLSRLASQRPAIVVTGARGTGKAALLRRVFPGHRFVSLDVPADAERAEREPAEFLRAHPPPLLVDEAQYAPGLFRHLKRHIDNTRDQNGQLILTGSQKFTLMKSVSESLAGRVAILELETLGLGEVRAAVPEVDALDWVVRGGFPELWVNRTLDGAEFCRSYVATYLERDLRSVLRVNNLRDFERFLRACALRSSQLLNKYDLARDVGISVMTAGDWLNALVASNQVQLLEPWFSNGSKTLARSPKLYFLDTGLLLFFLNIRTRDALMESPLRGAVWETAVYGTLRRLLLLRGEQDSLFFLRDREKEVDFVLHRGGRFHLWEAKFTESPNAGDAAGFRHAEKVLGAGNILSRSVVGRVPTSHPLTADGVRAENLDTLAIPA